MTLHRCHGVGSTGDNARYTVLRILKCGDRCRLDYLRWLRSEHLESWIG